MRKQIKKRLIQKLWGWVCLAANCMIAFLYLAEQRADLLGIGVLGSVSIVGYGAFKTYLDKQKGDISVASIVVEYVCLYAISFLLGFKVGSDICALSVLTALVIASLIEMLIFLAITYWQTICRTFLRSKYKG